MTADISWRHHPINLMSVTSSYFSGKLPSEWVALVSLIIKLLLSSVCERVPGDSSQYQHHQWHWHWWITPCWDLNLLDAAMLTIKSAHQHSPVSTREQNCQGTESQNLTSDSQTSESRPGTPAFLECFLAPEELRELVGPTEGEILESLHCV